MLIPTQTYCLTQFAGLFFSDLLLMSLSVWFTSHFCFLFLNYMKMELPFVIQSSLQSCAWLFPVSISVTCYPNHFPFIQLLILLTVEPAVATDLTSNPNQPWFHKMSAMQFETRAMAASDYPPSPQSTPHKWPDSFRLPPTHWLDIPYRSKMLHTLPH